MAIESLDKVNEFIASFRKAARTGITIVDRPSFWNTIERMEISIDTAEEIIMEVTATDYFNSRYAVKV